VPWVIPLESEAARDPALAGGKAAALARLAGRQLPIPAGFVVTTAAYDRFVGGVLTTAIDGILSNADPRDPAAAEAASAAIRTLFRDRPIPDTIETEIAAARSRLACPLVAVRSSATAEDLPADSFAGQQDSFLNVAGDRDLMRAIVDCWSSLWTARAIAYRTRLSESDARALDRLSLAVLVQGMVPAEYAGVVFTANPVSGARDEIVVEAVPGLGDALVSGRVEPDRFAFDHDLQGFQHHGVSVPEHVARGAARLGLQVAELAGEPQDVEWAWAGDAVSLLQARPITSLYPLPDHDGTGHRCYLSFGAIQGMLDPMTPLGRDTIRGIFSGAANLFGAGVTWQTQRVLKTAGERLWIDVTPLLHHRIGRHIVAGVLSVMEPRMGRIVEETMAWRAVGTRSSVRIRTAMRIPRVAGPMAMRALLALAAPEWSRRRAQRRLQMLAHPANADPRETRGLEAALAMLAAVWRDAFPTMIPHLVPRVVVSVACQRAVGRLARDLPAGDSAALLISRGVPHNTTADMNRALWEIAQQVRRDPAALDRLMGPFIDEYGARGEAEIDLGRPRWREDPAPLFQAVQVYLRAEGPPPPEAIAATAGREAEERVGGWVRTLRGRRGARPKAKAWLLAFCFRRYRALAGLREGPKFAVMRRLGAVRWALVRAGEALAGAGRLDRPDDIFFLHVGELDAGEVRGWRELARARRQRYNRERERRQVPLVLLSDGRALYGAAPGDSGNRLHGTPVSPGIAEGLVRVLDHPTSGVLAPGEILVCRGTDPAWTPLFLAAGGLVTEVGGVMSHGAVVAREYGIPAVVGVAGATVHLRTGQRIRIDGASGGIAAIGE
jgi:rifampicin phosphotransferase